MEIDYTIMVNNRSQLQAQCTENKSVLQELLGGGQGGGQGDEQVFKLIGPVLLKVDKIEARQNVEKRLEFIAGEINRLDSGMKENESKSNVLKADLINQQTK